MESGVDTELSKNSTSRGDLYEMPEKEENDDSELGGTPELPTETAKEEPPGPHHPSSFPDGGFDAWFCVVGGFCTIFASLGWINCMMLSI